MIVYKSRKMYTALQYDDELMEQTQTNSHTHACIHTLMQIYIYAV